MCALLAHRINRVPKKSFAILAEEPHYDDPSVFSNLAKPSSVYHQNCIVPDENYNIRLYSIGGKIQPSSLLPPSQPPSLPPPPPQPLLQKFYAPSKEFFSRVSAKLKALGSTVTEDSANETKHEIKKMDKPMFITTVRQGTFLEPPPEVAVLLGLRRNNFDDKFADDTSFNDRRKNLFYSFTSKPRLVKSNGITAAAASSTLLERQNGRQKREIKSTNENIEGSIHYGNTMYDRRVARGSNFATTRANPVLVEPLLNRQAEARRRAAVRQRAQIRARKLRMRTPPPVDGRKHEQMQTDRHNLEELTERPPENSIACQAALPFDDSSAVSTGELKYKNTRVVHVETQISPGDLPEYDDEIHSVAIASVVKNILQEAILEINDEIQNNYRNIFINESKITESTNSNGIPGYENAVIITRDEIRTLINGVIPNLMNLASSKIQREIENSDVFVSKILNEIRAAIKNENFVSGIIRNQLQNWSNANSRASSFENREENSTNDSDGERIRPASSTETDIDKPGGVETSREQGEQIETDHENQNTEINDLEQNTADELTTTIESSESLQGERNDENDESNEQSTIQQDSRTLEHNSDNAEQPTDTDNIDTKSRKKLLRSMTEKSEIKNKLAIRKTASEDTMSNTALETTFSTETSNRVDEKQSENVENDGTDIKTEPDDSIESVTVESNETPKEESSTVDRVEVEGLSEQQNETEEEFIDRNVDEEAEKELDDSSTEIQALDEIKYDVKNGDTRLGGNQTEKIESKDVEKPELNAQTEAAQVEQYEQDIRTDSIPTEIVSDEKTDETQPLNENDNVTSKSTDEIPEPNGQNAPDTSNDNDGNSKDDLETYDKDMIQETSGQPEKSAQNDFTTQNSIADARNEASERVESDNRLVDQQNENNTETNIFAAGSRNEQKEEPDSSTKSQEGTTENANEINLNETENEQNQSTTENVNEMNTNETEAEQDQSTNETEAEQDQSDNVVRDDASTSATPHPSLRIASESTEEYVESQSSSDTPVTTTYTITNTSETKITEVESIESEVENKLHNKSIGRNETTDELPTNETEMKNKEDSDSVSESNTADVQ